MTGRIFDSNDNFKQKENVETIIKNVSTEKSFLYSQNIGHEHEIHSTMHTIHKRISEQAYNENLARIKKEMINIHALPLKAMMIDERKKWIVSQTSLSVNILLDQFYLDCKNIIHKDGLLIGKVLPVENQSKNKNTSSSKYK